MAASELLLLSCWLLLYLLCRSSSENAYNIDLPFEHLSIYFNNHLKSTVQCQEDSHCPYKMLLNRSICWGYEKNCSTTDRYLNPLCPGDHKGWVTTKEEQINLFYQQGDFGYIEERRNTLEEICSPSSPDESLLKCSKHLQYCVAKNIWLNLSDLIKRRYDSLKYRNDILRPGDIGGFCRLKKDKLRSLGDHHSSLQSWSPELQNFIEMTNIPSRDDMCDVTIAKPAIIMKLDATVSMYHHFCDFFNLYASLHVNNSEYSTFTTDTQIIIWDNTPYRSNFLSVFEAFSDNPLLTLADLMGKRVCIRNLMLPMPPRMIFGLYYNTPLVSGCFQSGLFRAFNRFILHRLRIPFRRKVNSDRLRVTFLSRKTQYRRVINEEELITALQRNKRLSVKRVAYHWDTDFKDQVNTTHQSDIFIGMHGSGLTHLLFLPDWAVVIELHNCGDEHCYADLARLRGVEYLTWEDEDSVRVQMGEHPDLKSSHAKFANYHFDVRSFLKLVHTAEKRVRNNKEWKFARGHVSKDEL